MADIAKITLKGESEAKNFIDEALRGDIAYEELSTTVSKTGGYVAGDHLIYLGQYYEVVADIAQGGTIVTSGAGQNVEEREVGDEIKKNKTQVVAQIQTLTKVMGENGAKNKLSFDLESLKANNTSGTWSGNVYTMYGVSYTIHDDKTITTTGTASGSTSTLFLYGSSPLATENIFKGMIMNGCPEGGSSNKKMLAQGFSTSTPSGGTDYNDLGEGVTLGDESYLRIYIRYANGTDSGDTFKPMIRDARDTDPTYQPYAKTNKELTDVIDNVDGYYFEVDENAYGYSVTVNTDGVKSYKTLLNELATGLLAKAQALSSGEYIHVVSIQGYNGEWFLPLNTYFNFANSATSVNVHFRGLYAYSSNASIRQIAANTTLNSCGFQAWTFDTSGNTYADMSNDVPASGGSMSLKYTIKNRIFR